MFHNSLCPIEFVGGPFDGHTHVVARPVDELAGTAYLPINENVFRMMHGEDTGPRTPVRNFAVYELRNDGDCWRYEFRGTSPAQHSHLEL